MPDTAITPGIEHSTGGESIGTEINVRLWVLNFSDGEHSLLDNAERLWAAFLRYQ
jgi:aminopeptidase-like protein